MGGNLDENAPDMACKYFNIMKQHLRNEDIDGALKCIRALQQEAESRKGLNRPMIQLQAAKAMLEFHKEMAKMEIEKGKKGDKNIVNIYNTQQEDSDDPISISRRLVGGLSHSTKG